jgi:hypothetical protein
MGVFNDPFDERSPFQPKNSRYSRPTSGTLGNYTPLEYQPLAAGTQNPADFGKTPQVQGAPPDLPSSASPPDGSGKQGGAPFSDRGRDGGGGGMGGGGGRGGRGGGYFGNIQAKPTAYEEDVLSGYYLDLENNPYVKQYTEALTQDFNEGLGLASSHLQGAFAGGGTMGMSGALASSMGRLADDWGEDLSNQIAESYFGLYQSERQLMNDIDAILSGRTESLIGAEAAKYSADQSLKAAQATANATRYAASLASQLGYDQLAWEMTSFTEELNMKAYELSLYAGSGYLSGVSGALGGFGTSYGTGPYVSPFSSALQGGAGGAFLGGGLQGLL